MYVIFFNNYLSHLHFIKNMSPQFIRTRVSIYGEEKHKLFLNNCMISLIFNTHDINTVFMR